MSTIRVDNFAPSAGGTTYSARGVAKSWINFDGTGTVSIRDSENVSSLTDEGVGRYVVGVTSSFSNSDYSVPSSGTTSAGSSKATSNACYDRTTASFSLDSNSTGGALDPEEAVSACFGDLA